MKKLLLMAVLATSLFACKTAIKPAFDLESAKKDIAAHHEAFQDAVSKGDSVTLANLFSEDARRLGPNSPIVDGRAAIISTTATAMQVIGSVKLNTVDVFGDDNCLTEQGTYVLNKKDGSALDKGKFIAIYKKVEGKLFIYRDIWNSDDPVAAPASK